MAPRNQQPQGLAQAWIDDPDGTFIRYRDNMLDLLDKNLTSRADYLAAMHTAAVCRDEGRAKR